MVVAAAEAEEAEEDVAEEEDDFVPCRSVSTTEKELEEAAAAGKAFDALAPFESASD